MPITHWFQLLKPDDLLLSLCYTFVNYTFLAFVLRSDKKKQFHIVLWEIVTGTYQFLSV